MAGFVQVIEWTSSRIDEVKALNDQWRERFPEMGPRHVLGCADRDRDNAYMTIVEFESYEAAMNNSQDPATSEFAEKMSALCDGPPTFRNLDVVMEEQR